MDDKAKTTTGSICNMSARISDAEHALSLPQDPPPRIDETTGELFVSPAKASRILNETMNQLSIKERQEVYEDVHGVRFASNRHGIITFS